MRDNTVAKLGKTKRKLDLDAPCVSEMTASKRNYTALDEQNVTTKPAERKKERKIASQAEEPLGSICGAKLAGHKVYRHRCEKQD